MLSDGIGLDRDEALEITPYHNPRQLNTYVACMMQADSSLVVSISRKFLIDIDQAY